LNKDHGVGLSCDKVKADDMCAQDLLNAQGVNAPVTGSLRVQQPYGDKDEGKEIVNGGSQQSQNK